MSFPFLRGFFLSKICEFSFMQFLVFENLVYNLLVQYKYIFSKHSPIVYQFPQSSIDGLFNPSRFLTTTNYFTWVKLPRRRTCNFALNSLKLMFLNLNGTANKYFTAECSIILGKHLKICCFISFNKFRKQFRLARPLSEHFSPTSNRLSQYC